MKLLLTSDLDRTLIFSNRTKLVDGEYLAIEQLKGIDSSFMSTMTHRYLTELLPLINFVPVTTRSREQYERLTVFQTDIKPKFAVTTNGGTILINGEVDTNWQTQIAEKMAALPLLFEQLLEKFAVYLANPSVMRVDPVDGLFFVSYLDLEQFEKSGMEQFKQSLEMYNWTCYLQGRKLYIMPDFLTKGAAVQYIKSMDNYDWHGAAGDSQQDVSMMEIADEYFIPQHAELAELSDLKIMPERSSNFSDVYLNYVLEIIRKNEANELK